MLALSRRVPALVCVGGGGLRGGAGVCCACMS